MKIIFGLGNPGTEYEGTRHNIGFYFADKLRKAWDFPDYKYQNNYDAWFSKGIYDNKEVILAKPATFMNDSGKSVQTITQFYKIDPKDIIVIHDDLDIVVGNYKISKNVSSAGHNGIDSIIEKIGTQDFTRVRVGVEMEAGRQSRQTSGEEFVLQKFTEDELEKIKRISEDILNEIKKLI